MTERCRISAQVDPELDAAIKEIARDTGVRPSDAIRELLRVGLANFGRPQPVQKSRIVDDPFGLGSSNGDG